MASPGPDGPAGTEQRQPALPDSSRSKASKLMMDQQNFEAPPPASADPAVALAQALGQLPKTSPSKASLAKPPPTARPGVSARTSVEALASDLGVKLGD